MGIIDDNKGYLQNKHNGGLNSKKGNSFEDFYATYRIVALIDKFASDLGHVSFTDQAKNAFVDDLLIACPKKLFFHQIKDTKNLSWSTGKSPHTLQEDFELQKKACDEKAVAYELRLVYSSDNSNVKNIPEDLKSCTKLIHFNSAEDLNACILGNGDFMNSLAEISVNKSLDSLTNLGTCVLGIWAGSNQKQITLEYVYNQIAIVSKGKVLLKGYPSVPITDNCKDILLKIGVKYSQTGNLVSWEASLFKGDIAWSDEIDKMICDKNPKDILEILSIINQF